MTVRRSTIAAAFVLATLATLAAPVTPAAASTASSAVMPTDYLAPRPSPAQLAFVDTLERRTFLFFWDTAEPNTFLTPDRWPTRSFASVAAMGFGLASYPVGVERHWISRAQGVERTLATLRFLWRAPQDSAATGVIGYRGFYYHFLDPPTGTRFEHLELSFIDTGLLVAGALFCGHYFDGNDPREREIAALADSIYRRVDWRWMQPRAPLMALGWTPEGGHLPYDTAHYNETMLELLLAMGSPTHPADRDTWRRYARGYRWGRFEGEDHLGFAPLFGHQSSHLFVDFRGIRDSFMVAHKLDYFVNSRRATLAQRRYAIRNPAHWTGYGANEWGLSACDGPIDGDFTIDGVKRHFQTYWARGASFSEVLDDGTITPNAAGGSIAFAPEVVIPALMAMKQRHPRLWGQYGFLDAYNPSVRLEGHEKDGIDPQDGWVDHDYLGIDQGLIVLMIENWRTGLLWRCMRRDPYLRRGLKRAGFHGGWLERPAEPVR